MYTNIPVPLPTYNADAHESDIAREDERQRVALLEALSDEWCRLQAMVDEMEGNVN